MLKKWKALNDLECVKMYGHNHKMAHMIGTHAFSKCLGAIVAVAATEGLKKGLETKLDPKYIEPMKRRMLEFRSD